MQLLNYLKFTLRITSLLVCSLTSHHLNASINWIQLSRSSFGTGTTGLTISKPGNYLLTESVTASNGNSTYVITINSDAVTLDLGGNTIDASAAAGVAIYINGKKNIKIKNGTIASPGGKGIEVAANCNNVSILNIDITEGANTLLIISASNVTVESVHFNGSGATVSPIIIGNDLLNIRLENISISDYNATHAIYIGTGCSSLYLNKISTTNTRMCLFAHSFNASVLENSTFRNCRVNGINLTIEESEGFTIKNVGIYNTTHYPGSANALGILTCKGFSIVNCTVDSISSDSIGSDGIYLSNSNAGTISYCTIQYITGGEGELMNNGGNSMGILLSSCNSILVENCISKSISSNPDYTNSIRVSGFSSVNGITNKWVNCLALGLTVTTAGASTESDGAFGFYLENEQQSSLINCTAQGNGRLTGHTGTAGGFYLTNCKYVQLENCSAIANCTSATSGTTAFGFKDTTPDSTNIFTNCYAANNTDSAAIPVTTNYYFDLPVTGTDPAFYPVVQASMGSLIGLNSKPNYFNVSIIP